jgi:hypothetical protein
MLTVVLVSNLGERDHALHLLYFGRPSVGKILDSTLDNRKVYLLNLTDLDYPRAGEYKGLEHSTSHLAQNRLYRLSTSRSIPTIPTISTSNTRYG